MKNFNSSKTNWFKKPKRLIEAFITEINTLERRYTDTRLNYYQYAKTFFRKNMTYLLDQGSLLREKVKSKGQHIIFSLQYAFTRDNIYLSKSGSLLQWNVKLTNMQQKFSQEQILCTPHGRSKTEISLGREENVLFFRRLGEKLRKHLTFGTIVFNFSNIWEI